MSIRSSHPQRLCTDLVPNPLTKAWLSFVLLAYMRRHASATMTCYANFSHYHTQDVDVTLIFQGRSSECADFRAACTSCTPVGAYQCFRICLICSQTILVICLSRSWLKFPGWIYVLGYHSWLVVWVPLSVDPPNGVFGHCDLAALLRLPATPWSFVLTEGVLLTSI